MDLLGSVPCYWAETELRRPVSVILVYDGRLWYDSRTPIASQDQSQFGPFPPSPHPEKSCHHPLAICTARSSLCSPSDAGHSASGTFSLLEQKCLVHFLWQSKLVNLLWELLRAVLIRNAFSLRDNLFADRWKQKMSNKDDSFFESKSASGLDEFVSDCYLTRWHHMPQKIYQRWFPGSSWKCSFHIVELPGTLCILGDITSCSHDTLRNRAVPKDGVPLKICTFSVARSAKCGNSASDKWNSASDKWWTFMSMVA